MEELNKQQYKAATYKGDKKNLLVVAGAGTGKTKTMVSRTQFLIEKENISPEKILCLTFTNRAAKELVSRIGASMSNDTEGLVACTFHSFCIQLIKKIPKSFGYESQLPTIIDAGNQKTLLTTCLNTVLEEVELDEELKALIPKPAAILSEYSYARNSMRSTRKQFSNFLTDIEEIMDICLKTVEKYEEEKKSMDYVDFDDILERVVKVSEQKPKLAETISNLFYEVLVDELQDTNPIQYKILQILASGDSRMFAVGDPAQSIYGFRGADFESIYNFTKIFPNSEKIKLFENYRSTQEILDVSNALLEKSTLNYDNKLVAHKGYSGEKAQLHDFNDSQEEAQFVIRDLLKTKENEGIDFKDFFIIVRSAYSGTSVEGMLKRYNIPYEFVGGMAINKTAHVQDLLSILRFACNKKDALSCVRFLSMFPGVGEKTAFKAYRDMLEMSKEEIINYLPKIVKKDKQKVVSIYESTIEAINNNKNPIKAAMDNGFSTLLTERYLKNSDYRIRDIMTIIEIYKQYKGDIETFISDFTLEPSMNKVQETEDEEEDKVTLITAHSAKGLENEVCYIIGATPGTFPSSRSIGDKKTEEEERRTMYVALTRAKEKLVVTRVMNYDNFVFKNAKTNVNFIEDISDSFKKKAKKKMSDQIGGFGGLQDVF